MGQGGDRYRESNAAIDYAALGAWTEQLPGQVIVCEHEDAVWLGRPPTEARVLVGQSHTRSAAYWHRCEASPVEEAVALIPELVEFGGEVPSTQLLAAAKARGLSPATLSRARRLVGVESRQRDRRWYLRYRQAA